MNYIQFMRNFIGHETLITIGCGVIIEKEHQFRLGVIVAVASLSHR